MSEKIAKTLGFDPSYFSLGSYKWQLIIILGVAVSGLASYVTTYNALSKINTLSACTESAQLQHELQVKFIVTIVLACIAVVIGIVLSWIFGRNQTPHRLVTFGLTAAGLLGILYALSLRFRKLTDNVQLFISWGSFVAFIILGFLLEKSHGNLYNLKYPFSGDSGAEVDLP